ncbi:MAG: mannosyltransferase family protein [Chloroflexota bacterium]
MVQKSSLAQGYEWLRAARWLRVPLLAFTISRLGIVLIAYLAVPLVINASSPPPYHIRPDNTLLDVFGSRWDTGFYLSIAQEGYRYREVELPSVAFFPLLPLMIRALTTLTGDALVAGLIITNTALLLATMLFYRLVDEEWGPAVAGRAVWYLLIFPAAFLGSAIYSESLFLLGAIGSLYFFRRGYWESAALLGLATALSRTLGLILAPTLLVEWWMQRHRRPPETRPPVKALLAPAAVPLGTAAYMYYLHIAFGDPLAFLRGMAAWERQLQSPLATIASLFQRPAEGWTPALLTGRIHLNNWMDFLFVLMFLGLALILLYRRRWSEGLFVLLGTIIPASSGLLMSQRRYMWVLFPAYIVLARWGDRPWVDKAITTFSLMALALFTAMFAKGYWVG